MKEAKEVLVLGGRGMVGSRFVELAEPQFKITALNRSEMDLLNYTQLRRVLGESRAEVAINFAAFTKVDAAEQESGQKNKGIYHLNALAVKEIAEACQQSDKYFIQISTDYIFGGNKKSKPYAENDIPAPVNWYGKTKFDGERYFLDSGVRGSIVRIEMPYRAFYEPKQDIVRYFLGELEAGKEVEAIDDQKVTPVFIDDIAEALKRIIEEQPNDIFHVTPPDFTTPYDLARATAAVFGVDQDLVRPVKLKSFSKKRPAKRPQNPWLDSSHFRHVFGEDILHSVEESLENFHQQVMMVRRKNG